MSNGNKLIAAAMPVTHAGVACGEEDDGQITTARRAHLLFVKASQFPEDDQVIFARGPLR